MSVDTSGSNLYQQQGTRCCHPARVDQTQTWMNESGVASADALIEIGRAILGEQSTQTTPATQPDSNKTSGKEYPPSDANKVADRCNQIGAFRDSKGAGQSEPLWSASLSVVGHCQNGPEICQDWSSGHPEYDRAKTAKKLEHRLKTPPTTCAHFKKINPAGCLGCPHQINSPITLGWNLDKDGSQFQVLDTETEVIDPKKQIEDSSRNNTVLDKYSLSGKSSEIEKQLVEEKLILGPIALQGQITNIYAPPNAGKTLITLYLLTQCVEQGGIDPSKLFYLNMDDNSKGLLEKLHIAEEHGFHMLADGYRDFNANRFVNLIVEMINENQAHGVIIILDTLKKV
ncbi:MAG: hypothetical protein J5I87_01840, partial [Nitrosomonas nitrosa]|nr:hypothetical protein [Nitrosomonas nitrosa]